MRDFLYSGLILVSSCAMMSCGTFDQRKENFPAIYYGNYGGPGNNAPQRPIDVLDELFERHDWVYNNANTKKELLQADRGLREAISLLDSVQLTESGSKYAKKAKTFFSSGLHYFVRFDELIDGKHKPSMSEEQIRDYMLKGIPEN